METVVYRKRQRVPLVMETSSTDMSGILDQAELPESFQETGDLHPALFYPRISEAELTMWTHWLPTALVFRGGSQALGKGFLNRLERFNAPQEVVEECQWAWNMDLFEAYELRTPERRDMRDPVVLGRIGTQRYRIALWGESLRPLEEISALVEHSLAIRQRATHWQLWTTVGGALLGLGLGLWAAAQTPYEGYQFGITIVSTILGSGIGGFPFQIYTPENRQQQFLDRYRQ